MKKILLILVLLPFCGNAQIINTTAGTGSTGFSGDGGPASAAKIEWSCGLAYDILGNLYVVGGNRVRKIDAAGIITTVAGNGTPGYSGDGGPATNAMLNVPGFCAVDKLGNIYIADWFNYRIRRVSTSGIITTIAGNGTGGFSGDGGPATAAMLSDASGIAIDTIGNLYVCDGGYRVRKIATSGVITTIAGNGSYGYTGDGGPATAARLHGLEGICLDKAGNVYFADRGNYAIRKVSTSGVITTVAGNGFLGYTGDGGAATAATLDPMDVHCDNYGNLYISDHSTTDAIRFVNATSGFITTIVGTGVPGYAGDGGPATTAQISYVSGNVLDDCGNLYVTDDGNHRIRKVTFPHCGYLEADDVQRETPFSIHPNPASTELTITSSQKITKLSIASLLGQTVFLSEYKTEKVQVDVANLPMGVYLIRINDIEVKRFVKE